MGKSKVRSTTPRRGKRWVAWLSGLSLFLTGLLALNFFPASAPSTRPWVTAADSVSIALLPHALHAGVLLPAKAAGWSWCDSLGMDSTLHYVEIGWGEEDYYTLARPGLGVVLQAAFVPTGSVLHVAGFYEGDALVQQGKAASLVLSTQDYLALCHALSASFEGWPQPHIAKPKGWYGRQSIFFTGNEHYHALHTCNPWLARKLHAAGIQTPWLPVLPQGLPLAK